MHPECLSLDLKLLCFTQTPGLPFLKKGVCKKSTSLCPASQLQHHFVFRLEVHGRDLGRSSGKMQSSIVNTLCVLVCVSVGWCVESVVVVVVCWRVSGSEWVHVWCVVCGW